MTDYIKKALEGDYKDFIESLIKIVGNEGRPKRFGRSTHCNDNF